MSKYSFFFLCVLELLTRKSLTKGRPGNMGRPLWLERLLADLHDLSPTSNGQVLK